METPLSTKRADQRRLRHEFVTRFPERLDEWTIYISIDFATAVHNCLCGCGNRVVTPFSPTDWCLLYDGETVSLRPSIGNWNFECQSHYWITADQVRWSRRWTREEIDKGRREDAAAKALREERRQRDEDHINSNADSERHERALWEAAKRSKGK
jgi:hypothetical protein